MVVSRRVIFWLLGIAVVLLVAFLVVGALSLLLSTVGDVEGMRTVGHVAVTLIVLLAVDLICLVLALGMDSASRSDDPPTAPPP